LEKGRTEQSMIITGLRGVGKTVLLGAFREKALESGWVTVELEASKHDDTRFSEELFYKFKAALFELSPRKRWGQESNEQHRFSLPLGSPSILPEICP